MYIYIQYHGIEDLTKQRVGIKMTIASEGETLYYEFVTFYTVT